MKKALAVCLAVSVGGCTSLEKQQSNEQAQIEMVRMQREAAEREELTESQEKAALYNAIAQIASTNPEHSPAALVALTAISMNADDEDGDGAMPLIGLRETPNEALLWTQALAPTVGAVVNGLGVAMVGASVAKRQSDNSRDIQMNDANTDAQIIASVADLGVAAVGAGGISAGGDIYQVQDQGIIDQSIYESADTTTTTTTDYSATDSGFINTGVNEHTDYTVDLNTTLNYDGDNMSLADLIASLQAAGAAYSISFDGVEVASSDGDGTSTTTTTIDCTVPQFSPSHPDCV